VANPASLFVLALAAAVAAPSPAPPVAAQAPPTARREPVVDTYHGVQVVDPYRWLEDGSSPQVQEWSDAENAYARSVLDALPEAPELSRRIGAIVAATPERYGDFRTAGGTLFALASKPPKQQSFLVALLSTDGPAGQRVLVDPNAIDPSGATTIDWFEPSPDGRLLAVSLSAGGSEAGDVHLFSADDGHDTGDLVPRVQEGTAGGSLAWAHDGSGFFYTRYPSPDERPAEDLPFYQQVWFHHLGTPTADDRYEIGRDLPKTAEIALRTAPDSATVLATVQDGDSGRFAHFLRGADGTWKSLDGFQDGVVQAVFAPGGDLYLISRHEAPRGRILRLPAGADHLAAAEVVVPEGEDSLVTDFSGPSPLVVTADRLYAVYQLGGPSEIRAFDRQGHPQPAPRQLPVSAVSGLALVDGGALLFHDVSDVDAPAWYRFDPAAGTTVKTGFSSPPPVDFSDAEAVRETAWSKDGTRVPVTVVRRKGTRLDGDNPTLLAGYGGFGISVEPGYKPLLRVWLDGGGVFAVANLRGGGEFGGAWHDAGRLLNKQNTFDDFAAAMEHLIAAGYTRPGRLAILGGSNGGLLMGAVLTQHPELCRAVVSSVGIYDMLRNELTPNGHFNVPEYGSVSDPYQFRALYAYSPYHHVVDGAPYPAVLMMTGANDPRVDPMHSRKMTARLQAATSSGRPILLRTSANTGHGIGSPLSEVIAHQVDVDAFLFDQLGMSFQPAAAPAPGR
jgi:prolyl oligopeptidase